MEYEIELKLLTDKTAGEIIDTKLLPELKVDVKRDTLILTNYYFDTPQRTLRKNDIGLRIRGNNQDFEQTLKTAGKSLGGLHQRPEYNVTLNAQSSEKNNSPALFPKLALFPKTAWPENIKPEELETKLEVLFTTHFKRERYLIALTAEDSVELVWDLGEIRSGNKILEICEIELELKQGSANALFTLAKHLVQLMPTSIGIDSKAARGYSLLADYVPKDHNQHNVELSKQLPIDLKGFVQLLEYRLRHFQQLLSALLHNNTRHNIMATQNALSLLCTHVANFAEKFPNKFIQQHKKQLEKLFASWPVEADSIQTSELIRLLTSPATTQMQLDILQTLLEQPWSATNNSL